MEENRASRCKLTIISSIDFSIKAPKQFSGKWKVFSNIGGRKTGYSYPKKSINLDIYLISHRNLTQNESGAKCKSWNYKV